MCFIWELGDGPLKNPKEQKQHTTVVIEENNKKVKYLWPKNTVAKMTKTSRKQFILLEPVTLKKTSIQCLDM